MTRRLMLVVLSVASTPAFADVLFSEYVEGSSFNKAVEIHNNGAAAVDLGAGGYRLELYSNGSTSLTSDYALSGVLAAGETRVICHPSSAAALLAVCDEQSGVINFNGDDAFVLRSGGEAGPLADVIGQIGFDPGSEWGSGDTSTANNTIRRLDSVVSGDGNPDDAFDPAAEWAGFAQDRFDGLGCAGINACGGGSEPQAARIYEIQGSAHVSPRVGERVETIGIVTVVDGNGFYLQDPQGDGDLNTSDALYVYTGAAPGVAVGDAVTVEGTVTEYRPGGNSTANLTITELSSPIVTEGTGVFDGATVSPTLLGAAGRLPPHRHIDNDTLGSVENPAETSYDPSEDGIDFFESLEGMLVSLANARVVAPTNRFGEVWVLADNGAGASGLNLRGGITQTEQAEGIDYNPERIQLDDSLGVATPEAQTGALIDSLRGVISYSFGNFELLLDEIGAVTSSSLAAEVSGLAGDAAGLTVAAYNVENLDPNDADNGNASGCPDADLADGKFAAIANHVVAHLNSPDIVALQEVQDDSGCSDDGVVSGELSLATLVAAIVDAGGPQYTGLEVAPNDGADGGMPGGNIRVAYLYNAARVAHVEGTMGAGDADAATAPVLDGGRLALSLSPGRVDPTNAAWNASRKPLAAMFDFGGQRLLLVNNHWASKGGSEPLFGVNQPPLNADQDQREAQAQVVNDFVDSVLAIEPDAQVVVLGDLNEFSFLPPLAILRGEDGQVLFDLADELLPAEERYSYVFEGNSQTLDHELVSAALRERAEIDLVHLNAEFLGQTSDHDPVLLRLSWDAQPDAFGFEPQFDVPLDTWVESEPVTISGIELPVPILVAGGEYSVDGSAYTAAEGTVTNGQQVRVRVLSASDYETTSSADLTVGGEAASFAVTTEASGEEPRFPLLRKLIEWLRNR